MPLWAPIGVGLAALALIIAAARAPSWFEVRSPRRQALLKRIGLMTYPLFLTHNIVGAGIIRQATALGLNQWAALLLAVVSVLAIAYVICATAEVEVRKQLRAVIETVERLARPRALQ
jgi:peptidoglycan/LPS O-acetylase OafA/YrhL